MKLFLKKGCLLTGLLMLTLFIQNVQAQKETFFHHFNWNQAYYTAAGTGAKGFTLNSLYRNFNDSINRFLSVGVPVNRLNSAVGFYYLHNTSAENQRIESGLSYTGFFRLGQEGSLRMGIQGNRHQQAYCERSLAFGEYRTVSVYYTADASVFLQRGKLALGFSLRNILPKSMHDKREYALLLGFHELRTNSWLRSSPYLLMRILPEQDVPELRYKYTATIANFLMLGGSYYRNSSYLYGLHAGFKIANALWLTAATDYVDTSLPYRAIYEFGLRLNIHKRNEKGHIDQTIENLD